MGTSSSKSMNDLSEIQSKVQQQAVSIKELTFLTYDEFVSSVKRLNEIAKTLPNRRGHRLVFAIKGGTDDTVLWKATVRIGCVKTDGTRNKIESGRLLNLKQFIEVYKMMMYQVSVARDGNSSNSHSNAACSSTSMPNETVDAHLCTSVVKGNRSSVCSGDDEEDIFKSLEAEHSLEKGDECCICMDRKPEIILPCTHSYCLVCIENWNVSHKTCPVCRETVENTDDSWVISEAPDSEEMSAEIRKYLVGLVYKKGDTKY